MPARLASKIQEEVSENTYFTPFSPPKSHPKIKKGLLASESIGSYCCGIQSLKVSEKKVGVKDLTSQEAEKFGLDPNQGVMVTWLDAKGPLKEAGFEIGDVILGINNQPIQGVDIFATMMDYLKPHQKIAVAALDHRTGNRGMVQVVVR